MSTTDDSTPRDPDTGSTENAEFPDPSGIRHNDDDSAKTGINNEHIIVERYSYSPKNDQYDVLSGSFYDDEDDW